MAEVKAYWKLFQQQNVVDGLRVFVELSDDFIELLRSGNVLSEKTLACVQSYPWPANRTELIQGLVRRRWTKETFEKFYDALRKTQNAQLCKLFSDRLNSAPKTSETLTLSNLDTELKQLSFSNDLYTGMDELLKPLPLESRVTLQTMLRNRDVQIDRLRTENERMEEELQNATSDAQRYKLLDSQLTDWLSGLDIELPPSTSQPEATAIAAESLKAVDRLIEEQSRRIEQLESGETELKGTVEALREEKDNLIAECRLLRSEVIGLNERQETKSVVEAAKPKSASVEILQLDDDHDLASKPKDNASGESSSKKVFPKRKTSVPLPPKPLSDHLKQELSSSGGRERSNSLPKASLQQFKRQPESSRPTTRRPKAVNAKPTKADAVGKATVYKLTFNARLE